MPAVGDAMAFFWVVVMRGGMKAWVVEVTSKIALAFGELVPMPTLPPNEVLNPSLSTRTLSLELREIRCFIALSAKFQLPKDEPFIALVIRLALELNAPVKAVTTNLLLPTTKSPVELSDVNAPVAGVVAPTVAPLISPPVIATAARVPTLVKLLANTFDARVAPVSVPAAAATVMAALPSKFVSLIALGVVRVAALPVVDWFRVGNVQFVSVPPDGVPSAPPENSNVLLASGRVKTLVLVVGPVN